MSFVVSSISIIVFKKCRDSFFSFLPVNMLVSKCFMCSCLCHWEKVTSENKGHEHARDDVGRNNG